MKNKSNLHSDIETWSSSLVILVSLKVLELTAVISFLSETTVDFYRRQYIQWTADTSILMSQSTY